MWERMEMLYELHDELYLRVLNFCDPRSLRRLARTDSTIRATVNRLWKDTRHKSLMDGLHWRTAAEYPEMQGAHLSSQTWFMKSERHSVHGWASIATNLKILLEIHTFDWTTVDNANMTPAQLATIQRHHSISVVLSHPEVGSPTRGRSTETSVILVDGRGQVSRSLYHRRIIDARLLECSIVGGASFPFENLKIRHQEDVHIRALKLTFDDFSSQYLAFKHGPSLHPRTRDTDLYGLEVGVDEPPNSQLLSQIPHDVMVEGNYLEVSDPRRLLSVPFRYWETVRNRGSDSYFSTTTYKQGVVDVLGRYTQGTRNWPEPLFQEMALLRGRSVYDLCLRKNRINANPVDAADLLKLTTPHGPSGPVPYLTCIHCRIPEVLAGEALRYATVVMSPDNVCVLQGYVPSSELVNIRPRDFKETLFKYLCECYMESGGFPFLISERECTELKYFHRTAFSASSQDTKWAFLALIKGQIGLAWSELLDDSEDFRVVGEQELRKFYVDTGKHGDREEIEETCSALRIECSNLHDMREQMESFIYFVGMKKVEVLSVSLRARGPSHAILRGIQRRMKPEMDAVLELTQRSDTPYRFYVRQLSKVEDLNVFVKMLYIAGM